MTRSTSRRWAAPALAATVLAAPAGVLATPAVAQAAAAGPCPTNAGRIACVDLTHQRMWVQNGKRVVFGPVRIRSGRRGSATRAGVYRVYRRDLHHRSHLFNLEPMPWSQFFDHGEAFHGTPDRLTDPHGSHGCVNLTYANARALWTVLKLHDPVKVFGHRKGT